jgi:hypothetical protein
MNDVERRIIELYASIPPHRLYDAKLYMSSETFKMIKVSIRSFAPTIPHTAFGIPIEIDDNLPLGIVNLSVETGVDRWVKRQCEAGRTVNITKLTFPEPILPPAPDLTLRALLRHWTRKVFKR